MAEPRTTSAPRVYALLAEQRNLAADDALLQALPDVEPELQPVALDTLVRRGRDRGLVGLVGAFAGYGSALQDLVVSRVTGLYAGARLAIADDKLEVRLSAAELIARSGDARLAYLLAEALCQPCHKTRAAAGGALRDLTANHLERLAAAGRGQTNLGDLEQQGEYLAQALQRAVEGWDLHFRVEVLIAAMWMADRLEGSLLAKAAAGRSSFRRALLERLIAPDDARLAGFALRALRSPDLRAEVAKCLGACTKMEFVRGLIAESWLLADPAIARECARIHRWAWLEAGSEAALALSPHEATGALRLVAASGAPPAVKETIYTRLLAGGNEAVQRSAFWRLAGLPTEGAAAALRALAHRGDGRSSLMARRELDRRARQAGPAGAVAGNQPAACPPGPPGTDTAGGTGEQSVHPFDAFWSAFDDLDEDGRREAGDELVGTCPDLPRRLEGKLASGRPEDRTRALAMARALGQVKALELHVYRLANDADPVTRSLAVALLAELEGPVARRIARRALNDPDARVQANAIEVLDEFPLPDKGKDLAPKLESPHPRVRATAVAALLRMETHKAAETLLDMLADSSRDHRISALWVVERLQLSSLIGRLGEMARSDPDERVRRRARRVWRGLGPPVWRQARESGPVAVAAGQEDEP